MYRWPSHKAVANSVFSALSPRYARKCGFIPDGVRAESQEPRYSPRSSLAMCRKALSRMILLTEFDTPPAQFVQSSPQILD